jgi:hypothetical protein
MESQQQCWLFLFMKIWITRPDVTTLYCHGLKFCLIWLEKPFYNTERRGEVIGGRLFKDSPIGWMVAETTPGTHSYQLRNWFGKNSDSPYWHFYLHVWEEVCLDVDGCIAGDWPGVEMRWLHWNYSDIGQNADHHIFWEESKTFCLELDIPPDLWWEIAKSNSEAECREAKREQDWFWNDIPF